MSRKPISIVHLITELNVGGAERMLYRLATRLDRRQFRCMVVSMTDSGAIGEKLKAEGVPVQCLGMQLGRPTARGFFKLFRLLRATSADIVQTWLYHADLLGLLAGRLAGAGKIAWGIRCSDMRLENYRLLTWLTVRICGVLSAFPDVIVVNSEKGKDVHLRQGYRPKKMTIIPNGIDTSRFRPDVEARKRLLSELGIQRRAVLIGLVARFDPMKDHRTFFRAAAIAASKEEGLHFVAAGKDVTSDNGQLVSMITPGLWQRVHLLGLRQDIPEITAALDIAVSSSAYGEGFSNTIVEAMSCSVPCVVTDVGDSARIVGDTGLAVSPGDSEDMAEAFLKMVRMDEAGRRVLGGRARSRVVENFDLNIVVEKFELLYKRLMGMEVTWG